MRQAAKRPGEAHTALDPGVSEWGNPPGRRPGTPERAGERGELKHLSSRGKRKQTRFPE